MKIFTIIAALFVSTSAFAFNTPLSTSKAKIQLGLSSMSLPASSKIEAIIARDSDLLVSYKTAENKCFMQYIPLSFDELGNPLVPEVLLPEAIEVECQI